MVGQDIGAYITAEPAQAPSVITAGAGIDGAEQNGLIVDRLALPALFQSAEVEICGITTLAASATLTITANVQDGDNSALSDAADYVYDPAGGTGLLAATVVKTGAVTNGVWKTRLKVNLVRAKRYLRTQITADLSAAGTDTCAFSATWIFGGGESVPVA